MTTSARPLVRLTSPGEIAAAVPHLCGYVPAESLVVLSLRGPRARLGLTMRFDLPAPEGEHALAGEAAARLAADGAARTVAVLLTAAPGDRPRPELTAAFRESCRREGVRVDDVLLVREGRWWSLVCSDHACCPAEGTPLPSAEGSTALGIVAAHQALDGRAVLDSRAALVASVAPPALLAERAALAALDRAAHERVRARTATGRRAANDDVLERWRTAVARHACPPTELTDDEAAELAVSLEDVLVRDAVVGWALREPAGVLGALLTLVRRTPPPYDAPVCTALGWVAYTQGEGALANVALDRALTSRPGYPLARLLRSALDGQVPPAQVRAVLRASGGRPRASPLSAASGGSRARRRRRS